MNIYCQIFKNCICIIKLNFSFHRKRRWLVIVALPLEINVLSLEFPDYIQLLHLFIGSLLPYFAKVIIILNYHLFYDKILYTEAFIDLGNVYNYFLRGFLHPPKRKIPLNKYPPPKKKKVKIDCPLFL